MVEPAKRHPENRDVSARWLLWFGAGFVVFLGAVLGTLALLFDTAPRWPAPGGAFENNDRSPTLQRDAEADLAKVTAREKAELKMTGWVDREAGIARIPIGDAMALIAAKGLPDWIGKPSAEDGECGQLTANVPRAPQATDCRDRSDPQGASEPHAPAPDNPLGNAIDGRAP